jgi:arsenate reductase-like glutaredoxin family protein
MEVQMFGLKSDAATRKAQRFFAERRIKVHFVDLKQRAIQPGELKRFLQKLGLSAIVDSGSKHFADSGLAHQRLTEERWIEKLSGDPLLLKLPLVRFGQQLTVGEAEETWKAWVAAEKG